MLACRDLAAGAHDRVGQIGSKRAELGIGPGRSDFDVPKGGDQRGLCRERNAGDREVLECSRRVDPPERTSRHGELAESVPLKPRVVAGHGGEL